MDQVISIANNVKVDTVWSTIEFVLLVLIVLAVLRYRITGEKIAYIGFIIFAFAIVLSSFGVDIIAQKISAVVFILFLVSFIKQFVLHLRKDN